MPLPVILLSLAAAAPEAPINVVGHAWAPFISPMGEPFRARDASDDTLARWFRQADRNGNGLLTVDEMEADADRFFTTLDTNHDGEIDPDELTHYEWEVAPEIQVMSKTRRPAGAPAARKNPADTDEDPALGERPRRNGDLEGSLGFGGSLQGAARYSILDIPQPVAAADADFNRSITRAEFRAAAISRFQLLDGARRGSLTIFQLEALRPVLPEWRHHRTANPNARDTRIGNPLPPGN